MCFNATVHNISFGSFHEFSKNEFVYYQGRTEGVAQGAHLAKGTRASEARPLVCSKARPEHRETSLYSNTVSSLASST